MLAEVSIIPIGTEPHLRDQVADVVAVIDESGLPYVLTPSGRCIEGEWDDVMKVVHRCHDKARQNATHVQTFISIEHEKNGKNGKNKLHANADALEKIGHSLRSEHEKELAMKIEAATQLETIATSVPGAIGVFESLGIDYACGARLSIREAAEIAGVDPPALIAALQSLSAAAKEIDWSARTLADIARTVTADHHEMIRDLLPAAALGLTSLTNGRTADLISLRAEVAALSAELIPHIHDEERNVFRLVEAMESAWQSNERPPELDHGLRKRIADLTVAHGTIAQRMHRIRDLRLRISGGIDVSPECTAVLALLEKFEAHLRQQMFIENCILFPRALALEEEMTATAANAPAG